MKNLSPRGWRNQSKKNWKNIRKLARSGKVGEEDKLLSVALLSARKAAEFLLLKFGGKKDWSKKEIPKSFGDSRKYIQVKEDLESEEIIRTEILKHFPKHSFIGEESQNSSGDEFIWVVDPICGTIAYLHGLETWSVSVALIKQMELLLGVVICPVIDEEYWAVKGKGAYCNDKKIHVSQTANLKDCLISIEHKIFRKTEEYPGITKDLVLKMRRLRVAESTGQELVYVACGRCDALIKGNQPLYDYAAGKIILEEAGGKLTDFGGRQVKIELDPEIGVDFLASNGKIHEEVLKYFKDD